MEEIEFCPMRITVKGPEPFTLIAVWACRVGKTEKDHYVGQVYKSLKAHPAWFQGPVIVAGDLNSNTRWDEGGGVGGHADVVRMFGEYGLSSAYHAHFDEEQGAESRPTEYFFRHRDRPYHVDYIFIPKPWLSRLQTVEVGGYGQWSRLSDHCPVIVDVQNP
jgi:exodeoxyribonuclease-3